MELRRNIYVLLTIAILSSCVKESTGEVQTLTITASLAPETKTYFSDHENGIVSWNTNDILWVFDESGTAYKFSGPSSSAAVSEFTCKDWPVSSVPQYALFNPKYSKARMLGGQIRAQIPSEQSISINRSFSKNSNIAVGKVAMNDGVYSAEMKNVCGLLKIVVKDDGIAQVRLSGNTGEKLSGTLMVDYNDGEPDYSFEVGASNEISLIPMVSSSTGEYRKGTYYICVPPQEFEKGISLYITDSEGLTAGIYSDSPLDLKRGKVVELGSIEKSALDFRKMDISSPLEIDFSRTGYHYGEDEFPSYDGNVVYLEPVGNGQTAEEDQIVDRTDDINNAIKNVTKPGTVVFKAGRYYVGKQILLNTSDVILKGETDMSATDPAKRNLSTVIGTLQDDSHPSLVVFGNRKSEPVKGDGVMITGARTPEGSLYVTVADSSPFTVGDCILVSRPDSDRWHHDLGMDAILSKDGSTTYSWTDYGHTFEIDAERIITSIVGNKLYLDAPLPMSIEAKYGQGYVYHCIHSGKRVSESGVEYINFDNLFDTSITSTQNGGSARPIDPYYSDENHYWNAIRFFGAEHCWVRGVTASHFSFSTVSIYGHSKNLTVEDCHSLHPVSIIYSPRRYAFAIARGQMCLFKGCTTEMDRHEFVTTGVYAVGPNAYVDCTGTKSFSNAGPHSHWATCILYDRVRTDKLLSVEDACYWGYSSGAQGWQGANHVFWNCEAPVIICQSPQVSARNWAWGCIGEKSWGSHDRTSNEGDRDDGNWYSHGTHIEPSSLYYHQLETRLAAGNTIMNIIK